MTVDLAARWLGGSVLAASDESFGLKENLLIEAPASFEPGHYDHRGEIVDGWETRRRRDEPGDCDWVIVRLGVAGIISSVDVDTSYFTGNFPSAVKIEALAAEGYPSVAALQTPDAPWHTLADATLTGNAHNLIDVDSPHRFTHLRLSAYPDGGIARLRVHGEVVPDARLWREVTVELSSAQFGARVAAVSDEFYTSATNLLRPDRATTMGEGWETARRRGGGPEACDSVHIALAAPGRLLRAEIDTTHFKYNASSDVALWGAADGGSSEWFSVLPRTKLQPDTRHVFVLDTAVVGTVRLDAFPDGGLSRVRLLGVPSDLDAALATWLATAPERVLGPN